MLSARSPGARITYTDKAGQTRQGVVWSAAPGPGCVWVHPIIGGHTTAQRPVKVRVITGARPSAKEVSE